MNLKNIPKKKKNFPNQKYYNNYYQKIEQLKDEKKNY